MSYGYGWLLKLQIVLAVTTSLPHNTVINDRHVALTDNDNLNQLHYLYDFVRSRLLFQSH